jgi:hypothetical protein
MKIIINKNKVAVSSILQISGSEDNENSGKKGEERKRGSVRDTFFYE